MTPSDTLMELLLQVYDEMDGSEREAWSMTDAESWLRDQRRYEMEHNLPPIECNSQMVYDIVRDFIHAYSSEEAAAPETEYQRLIAAETIAETNTPEHPARRQFHMCIICVSKSGVRQPGEATIRSMFLNNPHGAGYMVARGGRVEIHKGFMNLGDYLRAIRAECFTLQDSVVYHFRISTQAGVGPEMTHPFPLSTRPERMRHLDLSCRCGVAHNGVIRLTSDPSNERYSDTAIFITDYLSHIIRRRADLRDQRVMDSIFQIAQSKFAIMDGSGYIATVGKFINERGLLFSNASYLPWRMR